MKAEAAAGVGGITTLGQSPRDICIAWVSLTSVGHSLSGSKQSEDCS